MLLIHRTLAASFLLTVLPLVARGEVFLLPSGGEIRGAWQNRTEQRAKTYRIRTDEGIELSLPTSDVDVRTNSSVAEREYERTAPQYADTIEQQWAIAEWCRVHKLTHHRSEHLRRILELDPDHGGARRGLGYLQHEGQWVTKEEKRRSEGYEFYRGKWRMVQEIEIQEERSKLELAEKEWFVRLKAWRADLTTERAAAASQRIQSVKDPQAIRALAHLAANEADSRIRNLYLDGLKNINDAAACSALLYFALNVRDDDGFRESADRLRDVPMNVLKRPLLEALRDPLNVRINRAAVLLQRSQDPTLISPLIDALTTRQRVVEGTPGAGATTFGVSRGPDGTGGMSMSKSGATAHDVVITNRDVLEALIKLTGQNFEYDQRAWRYWYDIEKKRILVKAAGGEMRRE